MMKSKKSVLMMVAGAAAVAGISLLFTTEKGKQVRKKMVEGGGTGTDCLMSGLDQLKNMLSGFAATKTNDLESNVSNLLNKAEHKKEDIIDTLERKLEELKKNTSRTIAQNFKK